MHFYVNDKMNANKWALINNVLLFAYAPLHRPSLLQRRCVSWSNGREYINVRNAKMQSTKCAFACCVV